VPGQGSPTSGPDMLRVEALPAGDGDCLWVEWRDAGGTRHRMLIDGGHGQPARLPGGLAERLARQPEDQRTFDLVVCTHIDADHIGGLLALLTGPPAGFAVADLWFNGRRHLGDVLGPAQGDQLSALITQRSVPWNRAFGGTAVVVPAAGGLPVITLPGLRITLLSPARAQLVRLAQAWPQVLADAEKAAEPVTPAPDVLSRAEHDRDVELHLLRGRPYAPDRSAANGSSIAFVAEDDEGSRLLLAGDAQAEVLVSALRRVTRGGSQRIDLCKVPHHGSQHNVSRELLALLNCRDWLISTNGARHGHPHRVAMARILCRPEAETAWFNYRSATTEEYLDPALAARYRFSAGCPRAGQQGIMLTVRRGLVEQVG
jgi:beta-lactamase superfamily II metal-dependent hydrolase